MAVRLLYWMFVVVLGLALAAPTMSSADPGRGLSIKLRASEAKDAAIVEEVQLYSRSYALVIGIDNYTSGWPRLSNAVKDARKIKTALEAKGFEVTLEINPGAAKMKRAFEDFFIDRGGDADARLFVWFAGHGYTDEGGEGYLIPTDGALIRDRRRFLRTALSLREFGRFVRLAESKHVFTVFDSCFAGTIFDVARSAPPPQVTRMTTEPVRQFLTSGDRGQTVSDDGRFARLFVEALAGKRRADGNDDGYLTASELGAFLDTKMSNYSQNKQTPRYGKLRHPNYDQGDFVFALPAQIVVASKPSPTGSVTPPNPPAAPATVDKEVIFWEAVQNSGDALLYKAYQEQYPKGAFAALARARIEGLKSTKIEDEIEDLDERMWVHATSLSVRSGPGVKYAKVGNVAWGAAVEVTGNVRKRGWYRIALEDGGEGYVFAKYLGQNAPKQDVRVARRPDSPEHSGSGTAVRARVTAPQNPSPAHGTRPTDRIHVANANGARISDSVQQLLKDIIRRGLAPRGWKKIDRISLRLSDVSHRTENNPDYVAAKIAQGIFGAILGRGGQLGGRATPTIAVYNARATIIAELKDGTSWTDAASFKSKAPPRANHGRGIMKTVLTATSRAVERIAIRMSGGVPPVETSGVARKDEREDSDAEPETEENSD